MKNVLSALVCGVLTLVLLVQLQDVAAAKATWLIVVVVALLLIALISKKRAKNYIIVSILLLLVVPVVTSFGTRDREATSMEKNEVIEYLNAKYDNNTFSIVGSVFKNERVAGTDNAIAFDWSSFEVQVKDKNDFVFTVYGSGSGFNNIAALADDYSIARTICGGSNASNIRIELNAPLTANNWNGHTVQLYYDVNCGSISKAEFSETKELINIQNTKLAIINQSNMTDVNMHVTYKCSDGEVIFNENRFEK